MKGQPDWSGGQSLRPSPAPGIRWLRDPLHSCPLSGPRSPPPLSRRVDQFLGMSGMNHSEERIKVVSGALSSLSLGPQLPSLTPPWLFPVITFPAEGRRARQGRVGPQRALDPHPQGPRGCYTGQMSPWAGLPQGLPQSRDWVSWFCHGWGRSKKLPSRQCCLKRKRLP